MKLFPYSLTDVGRLRDHNEDNYLVNLDLQLFAVADGMGGHQAGEEASQLALDTLAGALRDAASGNDPLETLLTAARTAGHVVYDTAQSNPDLEGMGTTLTSLWFHQNNAYLAHVGDSRAYLIRNLEMRQLSEDHSWVFEQVKAGMITEEQAKESRLRHIITRSVGFERDVLIDGMTVPLQTGDCFLLCSDGLSNHLGSPEIAAIVNDHFYRNVPSTLVKSANERGGEDNVTVVLIYVANVS